MATVHERNPDATVYVGELEQRVTEPLLWELFLQAGPVVNVYIPKDKVTNQHNNYGFVEFRSEEDAEYAIKIMNMIKLYGKPIRVNRAQRDKRTLDVGANLFIGNLDAEVDEKLLYDTFSAFGVIIDTPKIMRDPDTGQSKGFGFVSFDSFEASDAAINAMNGQYLCGRPINVSYAFKKDSKTERHGSAAERLLAASVKRDNPSVPRPNVLFATGPNQIPMGPAPTSAPAMSAPPPAMPPAMAPPMPAMPAMPPMPGMMPGMPMMMPPPPPVPGAPAMPMPMMMPGMMMPPPMPGMMPGMPGMPAMMPGMMPPPPPPPPPSGQ